MDQLKNSLPKNAVDFFVVYARFEAALKAMKCARFNNEGKVLGVDYTCATRNLDEATSNTHQKSFLEYIRCQNIEWTILSDPPGLQKWNNSDQRYPLKFVRVVDGGGPAIPGCTVDLLTSMARVRNNLFHGGKFDSELGECRERSETLISESLEIICQMRAVWDEFNSAFDTLN